MCVTPRVSHRVIPSHVGREVPSARRVPLPTRNGVWGWVVMPGPVGSVGLSFSRITASPKAAWARSAFVTGSGQVLRSPDNRHTSGSMSDQGEGVAVGKFKEVLFGGTREGFCPHMGHHIPLASCFIALSLDGHRAEDPISTNEGQPAGGHSIASAIGDPHGLQSRLSGSAGEHLARHKHLFRALWRRREVSPLAKAR